MDLPIHLPIWAQLGFQELGVFPQQLQDFQELLPLCLGILQQGGHTLLPGLLVEMRMAVSTCGFYGDSIVAWEYIQRYPKILRVSWEYTAQCVFSHEKTNITCDRNSSKSLKRKKCWLATARHSFRISPFDFLHVLEICQTFAKKKDSYHLPSFAHDFHGMATMAHPQRRLCAKRRWQQQRPENPVVHGKIVVILCSCDIIVAFGKPSYIKHDIRWYHMIS